MNLDQRFFRKVKFTDGCWVWQGYLEANGYGRIRVSGTRRLVHRVMYESVVGVIPEGLTVDHLCRNRACVCPEHLEVCTRGENTLRGETVTAANLRKTHCPRGHPYDRVFNYSHTYRVCYECHKKSRRDSARRTRAKKNPATT